jgi:superfamily I DNA and/or RNA helicase
MASPETVAQLFPRLPIFDLVVFDEASQCRLEEALPVLTRAKRVVIAGDPKQLPPTRFFESSITASEDDDNVDSDQELFEAHQGEIEDVLAAALGLDIHQCYLDVHYRSRHADLIGFSNEQFYGSRLQAIPEHPRARSRHAPLSLVRADGFYEKRRNEAEADAVIKIVKDLLKRAQPPSIGISSSRSWRKPPRTTQSSQRVSLKRGRAAGRIPAKAYSSRIWKTCRATSAII